MTAYMCACLTTDLTCASAVNVMYFSEPYNVNNVEYQNIALAEQPLFSVDT